MRVLFEGKLHTRSSIRWIDELIRQSSAPIVCNCGVEASIAFAVDVVKQLTVVTNDRLTRWPYRERLAGHSLTHSRTNNRVLPLMMELSNCQSVLKNPSVAKEMDSTDVKFCT